MDPRESQCPNSKRPSRPFLNGHVIGPWRVGRRISYGEWSHVRLAQNLLTGQLAAVKIAAKPRNPSPISLVPDSARLSRHDDIQLIDREIVALKLLQHKHVVRLLDVWESEDELFAFFDYSNASPLISSLPRPMDFSKAMHYFRQLISVLHHCHGSHMTYGGLNPSSVLVERKDHITLLDFGHATWIDDDSPKVVHRINTSSDLDYCSPEALSSAPYDARVADVWSCGIIFCVLVTGCLPYEDFVVHSTKRKVILPSDIPPVAEDLLRHMLTEDGDNRIIIREILGHPALASIPPQKALFTPIVNHSKLRKLQSSKIKTVDPYICENLKCLWPGSSLSSIEFAIQNDSDSKEKTVYLHLLQYRIRSLYEYNSLQSKFKRIEKMFPPSHIKLLPRRDDDSQGSPDNSIAPPKRVFSVPTRLLQSFSHGLFRRTRRSIHHVDNTEEISGNGNSTPSISVIGPDAEVSYPSFSSNLNSVSPNFSDNNPSSFRSFSVSSPAHVYDHTHPSLQPADLHEAMDRIVRRSRHSPLSQFVLGAYEGSSDVNDSRVVSAVNTLSGSEFKPAESSAGEIDRQIVDTMNHVQSFTSPRTTNLMSSPHPIGLGITNYMGADGGFRLCNQEQSSSISVASVPSRTIRRKTSPWKVDGNNKENESFSHPVSHSRNSFRDGAKCHTTQTSSYGVKRSPDNHSALDDPGPADWHLLYNVHPIVTPDPDSTHTKPPHSSSRKRWLNLFTSRKNAASYSLISVEDISNTLSECELSLSKMRIVTERVKTSKASKEDPALRCRIDQGVAPFIKSASFMIAFTPVTLHPHVTAGYQTHLTLTLEEGAMSTLNQIYNILRRDWNLDIPTDLIGSPNPVRIAAGPAVRDGGLELAPWA